MFLGAALVLPRTLVLLLKFSAEVFRLNLLFEQRWASEQEAGERQEARCGR